jgi:WD40 repeat protein
MFNYLAACLAISLFAVAPALANEHTGSIIVSMNDNHTVLDSQANQVAPKILKPDNADVIDVGSYPPHIIATFDVPGSILGPPQAVWVSKDSSWAILTSSAKVDPSAQFGIGPDNRVSVVDLTSSPPHIIQSLTAGFGATTVRVSPSGKLALIANRNDGTLSIFTVSDKHLTPVGVYDLGKDSSPSGLGFVHDGKEVLVALRGLNEVAVLHVDGTKLSMDPRPITTGVSPFTLDINAAGTLAAVGNVGRGDGDMDTVSLIDLTQSPMRTIDIVGVPTGPEPLSFSPDGSYLAVGSQEGTFSPTSSPFFHDHGHLTDCFKSLFGLKLSVFNAWLRYVLSPSLQQIPYLAAILREAAAKK